MSDVKLTEFQERLLRYIERTGSTDGARKGLRTNNPNLTRSLRLLRQRGLIEGFWSETRLTDAGREALR